MTTQQLDVLPGGVREMFRRLGIAQRTGYKALLRGDFPFVRRIGGMYIVPTRAFEKYLEGQDPGRKS